jgi:hypothetical protein
MREQAPLPSRPILADQHFAPADVVRGRYDALLFHLLDQPGGAVVADAQVALDEANSIRSAGLRHQFGWQE